MNTRLVFLDLRVSPPRPMVAPSASVLGLGSFDGVHLAHAAILREVTRMRRERLAGGLCGVFCFFRPTTDFKTGGEGDQNHLTTLKEKLSLFAMAGMDFVCLCDFRDIRNTSFEDFCRLLTDRCGCRGAACGFNYRFGAGGDGRPEHLCRTFDAPGMAGVVVWPETTVDGLTVSSTHIRRALTDGNLTIANRLLGRPYALESRVRHGQHLGHSLGFPTINQFFPAERLIPAHGVYAARAIIPTGRYPAVANIGIRPTVTIGAGHPASAVNCETHIIGYCGDLYGQTVRVELISYLRPEQRFSDLNQLRQAIANDADTAVRILAQTGNTF